MKPAQFANAKDILHAARLKCHPHCTSLVNVPSIMDRSCGVLIPKTTIPFQCTPTRKQLLTSFPVWLVAIDDVMPVKNLGRDLRSYRS